MPYSTINAVGKLILCANSGKCEAGVLSKNKPTALKTIKQVLRHTKTFVKVSELTPSLRPVNQTSLQSFGVAK